MPILGFALLLGLLAVLILVVCFFLNSLFKRRAVERSQRVDRGESQGEKLQGWTEAGRRAVVPPEEKQ